MTTPRIYVGTYAKYNDGNLFGAWLDLADFSDRDEFEAACRELHKDEADPEFMFQDWEGLPSDMIGESYIDDGAFELASMDDEDRELLTVYRGHVCDGATLAEAREAFRGRYTNAAEYAESLADECGDLASVPEFIRYHIDWDGVARDMRLNGDCTFVELSYNDCWVFDNV